MYTPPEKTIKFDSAVCRTAELCEALPQNTPESISSVGAAFY